MNLYELGTKHHNSLVRENKKKQQLQRKLRYTSILEATIELELGTEGYKEWDFNRREHEWQTLRAQQKNEKRKTYVGSWRQRRGRWSVVSAAGLPGCGEESCSPSPMADPPVGGGDMVAAASSDDPDSASLGCYRVPRIITKRGTEVILVHQDGRKQRVVAGIDEGSVPTTTTWWQRGWSGGAGDWSAGSGGRDDGAEYSDISPYTLKYSRDGGGVPGRVRPTSKRSRHFDKMDRYVDYAVRPVNEDRSSRLQ